MGTGRDYSVLEIVRVFESASGKKIPCKIVDRRPGDIATCYADPRKERSQLGWVAKYGIDEMSLMPGAGNETTRMDMNKSVPFFLKC